MDHERQRTGREDRSMKKLVAAIVLFTTLFAFSKEDLPSILLPDIDVVIEDVKELEVSIMTEEQDLPELVFEPLPIPDFSEVIRVDLEKTLPEKIDSPEKQKPVDAIITFGYGLNNYLYTDFSIFVKQFNPKISIHYLRESKENLWFDRKYFQNVYSKDDLQTELVFTYGVFELGAELGYFAENYDLQEKSVYDYLTKRILNVDIGPSLKFNNQNDITLRVLNSFLFTENEGNPDDKQVKRSDFDYMLETDLIYTQIFGSNHYLTSNVGYDFNLLHTYNSDGKKDLKYNNDRYYFNNIKAGINYTTTVMDAFQIKVSTDFLGMFRETQFYWYLLPYGRFGYSLMDFFHCYVEGGGELNEKPDRFWFEENDFVIFPAETTPGYHWFAKTGLKGSFPGWISGSIDLEFAYNMSGFNWKLSSDEEQLYTIEKYTFYELNLGGTIDFNVKQYFNIILNWTHHFLDRMYFVPMDEFDVTFKWNIPKIGLSFFVDFYGGFYRFNTENIKMGNVYLLNTGIDWNWNERIGVGTKFNNILYFQNHQNMFGYDEPGFEFLGYVTVGF